MDSSILGIDIAKSSFQVTLRHATQTYRHTFRNDPTSFVELQTWLQHHGVTQLQTCMEATGRYGEALATYLHAQHYTVSVVNPAQIKFYAQSQLRRNKTDQVDADLIAAYAQTQHPAAWQPTRPEIRELEELVHQYDVLQQQLQQEKQRLQAGVQSAAVQQLLTQHRTFLETQLAAVRQLIEDHINRHPDLKQRQELLTSIPGIADLTAAKLQTMQLERFASARAASAFVGLNPRQYESGRSVHRRTRLSKVGHAALRRALYMPAVVAKRYNPVVQALAERLAAKGKPKLSIIGAAMHKLVCLAYGVLKSGKPFDPHFAQVVLATA